MAEIIRIVNEVVARSGFKVNKSKTKLQDARNGRRIITGVGVDDSGLYPTRKVLKKIRAAEHQKNELSLQGLKEWSKCKTPKPKEVKMENGYSYAKLDELFELARSWKIGLRKKDLRFISEKETVELGNNCVISGDPIDMLGMSTFTTGWTSCMSKKGSYKKGISFWILLRGTRIAYRYSDKTIRFGKTSRRRMIGRCLLHELRNGVLVYDKFYGHDADILEEELRKYGAISIKEARELHDGEKVRGNVPVLYKPYFDNLKSGTGARRGTSIRVRYAFI